MKLTRLFTKTSKNAPSDELSTNAILLERGGFVMKSSAGVYSYLPLGHIVIEKIKNIVRKRMNEIDGQEVFMPALLDPRILQPTGRDTLDIGFSAVDQETKGLSYILSWTHEEVISSIAKHFISSYKDLPRSVYQFQTKFRNEKRAKSGLLRGREFTMKDMYSFHRSNEDLMNYYEKSKTAYLAVFNDCGLQAYLTEAGGGDFTMSRTHEFQVLTGIGEDVIFYCESCKHAINSEISGDLKEGDRCTNCNEGELKSGKSVEVGNIFPLGTKYSDAFDLNYLDESGEPNKVYMGSYGIGIGRLMGVVVEEFNDDRGIIWPKSLAPFQIHLIGMDGVIEKATEIYDRLTRDGFDVLFDDRTDKTAGEKFADADLIGLPLRIIVSHRSLDTEAVEVKARNQPKEESKLIKLDKLIDFLKNETSD